MSSFITMDFSPLYNLEIHPPLHPLAKSKPYIFLSLLGRVLLQSLKQMRHSNYSFIIFAS